MTALMKIGEAAEWVGLSEKTIRYYEDIGLVTPLRSENGFRQFRSADIQALNLVKGARDLGFSLEDSRTLLALFNTPDRASADVRKIARRQLEETQRKIAKLDDLREHLERLVSECKGNDEPCCAILDFLADPRH